MAEPVSVVVVSSKVNTVSLPTSMSETSSVAPSALRPPSPRAGPPVWRQENSVGAARWDALSWTIVSLPSSTTGGSAISDSMPALGAGCG